MKAGIWAVAVTAVAGLALLLVSAASTTQVGHFQTDYVALGDSYSSGTGAGSYLDDSCARSESAYPSLLAEEFRGGFGFAACSGAETEDVLADQLDLLNSGTDLVTVGIGGNDIGWGTAVAACMQPESFDCVPVVEAAGAAIDNELPDLLDGVYSRIADVAPDADVYVLGYPRMFNEREPCGSIPFVTVEEQALMNSGADMLSEVIEDKAEEYGFTYVDVRDAFDGHAVCDEESWLHGFTGSGESFHPTAEGQELGYYAPLTEAL